MYIYLHTHISIFLKEKKKTLRHILHTTLYFAYFLLKISGYALHIKSVLILSESSIAFHGITTAQYIQQVPTYEQLSYAQLFLFTIL